MSKTAFNTYIQSFQGRKAAGVLTIRKFAREIDKRNKNNLWMDALKMEMENVKVDFDIQKDDTPIPVGYKEASGHLVWDVKMDFTRKTRWVKDGHKTDDPEGSNFAGVVSRNSI